MLKGVEGVFDLLGHGLCVGGRCGVGFVLERSGQENVAVLVWRGVEGVGWSGRVGESFEERGGGKAVVPLRMLGELFGCEGAGGVGLGKDEGAAEETFGLHG